MEVDSIDGSSPNPQQLHESNIRLPIGPGFEVKTYPDNHRRRGKAIIFNHIFKEDAELYRTAYIKDAIRLKGELKILGFEVEELVDPTYEEIKKTLNDTSKEDHSDADCVAVFVMSHGNQEHPEQKLKCKYPSEKFSMQLICAKDRQYDEKELFTPFEGDNCHETLLTKPKVFFIHACRNDASSGKEKANKFRTSNSEINASSTKGGFITCTIPKGADFLIFRATVDNTFAWGESTGSYFMQALCDEFERNRFREEGSMLHLESLFREIKLNFVFNQNKKNINQGMSLEKIEKEGSLRSQMPCVYSTLLRKLYWKPKKVVTYEETHKIPVTEP